MDHKLQFFYRRTKKYLISQTVLDSTPADYPRIVCYLTPRQKQSKKKVLQYTAIVQF